MTDSPEVVNGQAARSVDDGKNEPSAHPAMGVFFEYPSAEEAARYSRKLGSEEFFTINTISESMRGGDFEMPCFSVAEFVSSISGFKRMGSAASPVGGVMIDIPQFTAWYGDVIGDRAFVSVLEEHLRRDDPFTAQLDMVFSMVTARFWQYREVLDEEAEKTGCVS